MSSKPDVFSVLRIAARQSDWLFLAPALSPTLFSALQRRSCGGDLCMKTAFPVSITVSFG